MHITVYSLPLLRIPAQGTGVQSKESTRKSPAFFGYSRSLPSLFITTRLYQHPTERLFFNYRQKQKKTAIIDFIINYMFIFTRIYTYIHTHAYIYTHTYIYIYIYMHIHLCFFFFFRLIFI